MTCLFARTDSCVVLSDSFLPCPHSTPSLPFTLLLAPFSFLLLFFHLLLSFLLILLILLFLLPPPLPYYETWSLSISKAGLYVLMKLMMILNF